MLAPLEKIEKLICCEMKIENRSFWSRKLIEGPPRVRFLNSGKNGADFELLRNIAQKANRLRDQTIQKHKQHKTT